MTKTRSLSAVLSDLMAQHDLNDNELARRSGVSQPTITRIRNGTTLDPEGGTLATLAKFFGITPAQMRGEALMLGVAETPTRYNVTQGPAHRGQVPLVSWIRAGIWSDSGEPSPDTETQKWYPCPVAHSPRTFVLRVRGDSMFNPHGEKSFREGDLVFVDQEREAVHRSLVVVRLDDSKEATFKQLIIEGDRRYLKALNPGWPEQTIQINGSATIVGVAIFKGEEL
jgi:SOS-response transcriptional repressor LexA